MAACYQQAKRWQWGAIDIGFIAANTASAAPGRQLAVALAAAEHHLLYPLMWIVLAAAGAGPARRAPGPLARSNRIRRRRPAARDRERPQAAAPWLVDGWATGWRFRLWVGFFVANFGLLNALDAAYRELLARDRGCGGPAATCAGSGCPGAGPAPAGR